MESSKLNINYFALSFVGRRKNNEDNCLAVSLAPNVHFFAVADGMGGMNAGEVASKTVLDTTIKYIKKTLSSNLTYDNLKNILFKSFQAAQVALANKMHNNPSLQGMGSTLSCVLIYDDKFVIGNIGDSRVYLYRNGKLHQITSDHNYITDYLNKEGKMPNENLVRQYGHFITRALDGGSDEPDIFPKNEKYFSLKKGDMFLICSDGLITDKSERDTKNIAKQLVGTASLEQAAKNLISEAFYNGSTDNISVVLAEIGHLKRKKISVKKYSYPPIDDGINRQKIAGRKLSFKISYIYGLLVLLILIFIGGLLLNSPNHSQNVVKKNKKNSENLVQTKAKTNETESLSIDWVPFEEKDGLIIRGKNEALIWKEPNLKNDEVEKYSIIFKDIKGNPIFQKDNLKSPKISLKQLNAGRYSVSLICNTKKGKEIKKTLNLKVNE